jgi:nucleoside-diphosphate-sugar epimerase
VSRALVTGATGFLGRRLTSLLIARGWTVTVVHPVESDSQVTLERLHSEGATIARYTGADELRDSAQNARPDVVFHLATLYRRSHTPADIQRMMRANVEMGTILLDALAGMDCVVVAAMSYFQYRDSRPSSYSLYSATKQAFSVIASYYRELAALDVREVVLFDTYGPSDTREKLIPALIEAAVTRSNLSLGSSSQRLNLLFVDDVVDGLVAAAGGAAFERTALRADHNVTVGALVKELESAIGGSVDVTFDEGRAANDLVDHSGNWKAPEGWRPGVSLGQGLLETYRAAQPSDG